MSCVLSRHGVESASHTRFDAGGGVLVHRAARSDLVQLLDQQTILLFCLIHIAGRQKCLEVLNLGLHHALTSAVLDPAFGILSYPFFG